MSNLYLTKREIDLTITMLTSKLPWVSASYRELVLQIIDRLKEIRKGAP